MALFFTCIILIGSGITIFAFILMLAEKRRLYDYRVDMKDKKNDLIKVVEDAEALITEMNRYSDYIVTQIEEKHSALSQSLNDADIRIESLKTVENCEAAIELTPAYNEEAIAKILKEEKPEAVKDQAPIQKGKILTFDLKRREIIKLGKSGLDSTTIAKKLNCGKGEIELIARMGRQQ